jgi:hypothetical protein
MTRHTFQYPDYAVRIELGSREQGYPILSVTIRAEGEGVKADTMRDVALGDLRRRAMQAASITSPVEWFGSDRTAQVAAIYEDAVSQGLAPQKHVIEVTGLSRSTVSYQVAKARDLGYLPPSIRAERLK